MNTFINLDTISESNYPLKVTLEKSIPLCYSKCKKTNLTNKFKDMNECICNLKRSMRGILFWILLRDRLFFG